MAHHILTGRSAHRYDRRRSGTGTAATFTCGYDRRIEDLSTEPRANAALHPDRLFPAEPSVRSVARDLYAEIGDLPIVSMHGHIEAKLLADDEPFGDAVSVLVSPDHYVTRLLHSQGVPLESLGVGREVGNFAEPRSAWRALCTNWGVLKGTASSIWLSQELSELFGVEEEPSEQNADLLYEQINEALGSPQMRPRALYERFGIEVLATTDGALDDLAAHDRLRADSEFCSRVVPTFRPDLLLDPKRPNWRQSVERLGEVVGVPVERVDGLLEALFERRRWFVEKGALSTDHGQESALTIVDSVQELEKVYARLLAGAGGPGDAERFGALMLTEMARMSCEDGLAMQLHPGVDRDHDAGAAARFGRDIGADFPVPTPLTRELRPLLSEYGSRDGFDLVVYTVDETAFGRELAPMASYYPALKIGAPWWFLDAPDAMSRCWRAAVENAGFANFAGFVDDSRSLLSIRARHDMARRVVSSELARLVMEHRIDLQSARDVAVDYAYGAPKRVFGK
jgi:glucuronate isomerase